MDERPRYPVSGSWAEWRARWEDDLLSLPAEQHPLVGPILDLGWQAHINRHSARAQDQLAIQLIHEQAESQKELEQKLIGRAGFDDRRHGGYLPDMEARLLAGQDALKADVAQLHSLHEAGQKAERRRKIKLTEDWRFLALLIVAVISGTAAIIQAVHSFSPSAP